MLSLAEAERHSRHNRTKSGGVCAAAGWYRPCADAAPAMVSQACRRGIRKLTNFRITLHKMLVLHRQVCSIDRVTPSDAEMIEQLKRQLDAKTRQLDVTSQRLQLSELRVQLLEDKLRLQRIAKYGPGSEKLTNQQLEPLELEPGVSNLEVAAKGECEVLPATPDRRSASILAARRCLRIFRAWSA